MKDIVKLLIQEPPLQVLPSLAVAIGLNEAIVLQQLYYLLNDPRNGKEISGKKWIFNTYEDWQKHYFKFWDVRTIRRTFKSLAELGLIHACQPEGYASRRKYYRVRDDTKFSQPDNLAALNRTKRTLLKRPKVALPLTKTTAETSAKTSSNPSNHSHAERRSNGIDPLPREERPKEAHGEKVFELYGKKYSEAEAHRMCHENPDLILKFKHPNK